MVGLCQVSALGDSGLPHLTSGIQRLEFRLSDKSSKVLLHCYYKTVLPNAQHVKLVFPARDNMPKVAMPEVEVHWYDGGMMPDRPEAIPSR